MRQIACNCPEKKEKGASKGADTKRKRGTSHPRREGPGCGAGVKRQRSNWEAFPVLLLQRLRIYIQCNAPTFYEEIATVRLKDRYSNGEKTWRATLNVECPKCAKLHATALKKREGSQQGS